MELPTLFKKTSTGALQSWSIQTYFNIPTGESIILTRFGQVGGKIQEATDIIAEGKNIGKANETTAAQQAEAEALAKWTKQLKKGYARTLGDAASGATDEVIQGGVSPMLAHKFSEQGDKITFPALVQPKFDGHRCIAVVKDGRASLWTRTRKPITGLPHLIDDLEALAALVVNMTGLREFTLDGELYNHDYRANFEELSSFIRTPEPQPGSEVVQYHVYDFVGPGDQNQRQIRLNDIFAFLVSDGVSRLRQVETRLVNDEDDMMLAFDEFLAQGFEGLMVRNLAGLYVNKRSRDLQKVKKFDDAEFEVVAVTTGRGKMSDKAIFTCRTDSGATFEAKMKGKLDDLKKYVDDPSLAVGRLLTVQYQGVTNKSQVPRFPVGVRFRDDKQ